MIVLSFDPAAGEMNSTAPDSAAGTVLSGKECPRNSAADEDTHARPTGGHIENAEDAEQAGRLIHAAVKAMGFEWFDYGRLQRAGDKFHMKGFFQACASPQWTKSYFETRCFEVDPRVQAACRQEVPLVWDLQRLVSAELLNPSNRRTRDFLKAADAAGVRSGVMFSIADINGIDHAILSFYSAKASCCWIADSVVGQCYAEGLKLHSLLNCAVDSAPDAVPAVALSDIQRRTLKLMVNGLSSREIGEALATSVQNVDYHIRELRKKFDARNRVHLAYAAGRSLIG